MAKAGAELPPETENLRAVLKHGFADGRAVEATELTTLPPILSETRSQSELRDRFQEGAPHIREYSPMVPRRLPR